MKRKSAIRSRSRSGSLAPKIWIGLFVLWGFGLSGVVSHLTDRGGPGVLQALRLNALLTSKRDKLASIEAEIQRIQAESADLESNRLVQEREIRKTLGYAAPDEIVFDFGTSF